MKQLELGMYGLSRLKVESIGYDILTWKDARNVLSYAWYGGIKYVDTAPGYGNGVADELIKDSRLQGFNFRICSKIGLDVSRNEFKKSLRDIYDDVDKIAEAHGEYVSRVLIHSPPKTLIRDHASCRKIMLYIRKVLGEEVTVGFALRSPEDLLDCIWAKRERNLVFQANFSWLDTRIKRIAEELGLRVITRSIYGSGILSKLYNEVHTNVSIGSFSDGDIRSSWDIKGILSKAALEVSRFREECRKNNKASLDELVAKLILSEDFISGAILGPLRVKELEATLDAFRTCAR